MTEKRGRKLCPQAKASDWPPSQLRQPAILTLLVVAAVLGLFLNLGNALAQSVGITVDPADLGALTEAAGGSHSASFTVALDAQPTGDVTLTLTHGDDVSLDQTALTFSDANWSTAQTVTVTAVDDTIDEVDSEDFSIELSASGGGYGRVTAQVTGSVTDDDTASFTATLDKSTLAETDAGDAAGRATLTVTITSSGVSWPPDRDIDLTLSGTARVGEDFRLTVPRVGDDFRANDGEEWPLAKPFILRVAAGETSTRLFISVINDAHDDDAETLSIALEAAGAAIDTVGPLTITDDDDPPLLLSALAVTTAATRKMYPAFDENTFHYAVGCAANGFLGVSLSAKDTQTRVSVNGVQVANQNGKITVRGLDGASDRPDERARNTASDVEITLSDSDGGSTIYTVHCLPKGFPNVETSKQSGAWEGLITMMREVSIIADDVFDSVIAVIDNNGVLRFHRRAEKNTTHFRTQRNSPYPYSYGATIRSIPTNPADPSTRNYGTWSQVILNDQMEVVHRVHATDQLHTVALDFDIRENGNYVFPVLHYVQRDLTGYKNDVGNPRGSDDWVLDSVIQEQKPSGEVVRAVNSWDLFHLDDCLDKGRIVSLWALLNSVEVVDGDYIASFRKCNQVLRISGDTGKVVWRLGLSRKSDEYWAKRDGAVPLKIVNDPYGEFCGQHSARMQANGHILLFDNGGPDCTGDRPSSRFSRVVEYALDLEQGTATFVRHHSLQGAEKYFTGLTGVIELMDNGNWLISWGSAGTLPNDVAVTEVMPGPRWSQTQGTEVLTFKTFDAISRFLRTRSYPLSPGTLELAWPPGALTEAEVVSAYSTSSHGGEGAGVNVVVAFSRPVVDFDKTSPSVSVTGATIASVAPHVVAGEVAHAYLFKLTPTGDAAVEFELVAGQACTNGGICTKDGSTLSTVRSKRTVPGILVVSGLADTSLAENTAYGPVTPSVAPAPTGSATWTLEGDDADDFTIDTSTGALSMTARDFEAPTDADADNVYEVTVRATDTAGRTGALSIQVTVTNVNEPPGVPTGLALTAEVEALAVSWSDGDAPAGTTPPATTAYNVQYRLSSDTEWTPLTPKPRITGATIDDLTADLTYAVRVRAVNPDYYSAWTASVSATPSSAGITVDPADLGALTEAAGGSHSASFTVALDAQPTGDVTLTLTHGDDVSLDQTALTFSDANWSTAQTVTVTAVDDTIDEVDSEDFSIELSASGGGYGRVTAQVTGSVTDDDTASFTATLDKSTLAETDAGDAAGRATLTVTITSSGVSWAEDRDIDLTLSGTARVGEDFRLTVPRAGDDFRTNDGEEWTLAKPFILRFAAGETETTAFISVINDAHDDDAETLSIALEAAGAAIDTVGPLTITDDDDPPLLLSALAVTATATRQLFPAFDANTFHYAVGCETTDAQTTGKLTVTSSAADATTRVSVNGLQVANQNGEIDLTGLDGYSDVKIVLSNANGASTTYTVHCLPNVFSTIVTTKQPGAWDGLLTMGIRSGSESHIVIIDNNGVPRFHRHVSTGGMRVYHFRTHPNGKYPYSYAVQHGTLSDALQPGTILYTEQHAGAGQIRNYEQVVLDHDLSEVQRVRTVDLKHTDGHDFAIRENGNYILVAYEPVVRDLSGYSDLDGDPYGSSETVIDAIIQEVTPDGVVVHQVNSWDVFPLEDCAHANGYIHYDYAHINSVQAVGDDYIASYRYCNQIVRFNKETGKVVWRLGLSTQDDEYWIARDGRAPLKIVDDPYNEFCWQYSARLQPNGHLMLYDNNGNYCTGSRTPREFSRALEYVLDLEKGEARFVRHHSIGGNFKKYARFEGIVEVMGNGNWLISWGGHLPTAVTEVVPGPRWSETQGQRLLSVKIAHDGKSFAPRTYPLSPGTLERASPPGPLAEAEAVSNSNSAGHLGTTDTVNVVVAFSRPVVDFDKTSPSLSVTGATIASVAPHIAAGEAAHAYLFKLTPTGDAAVEFELVTGQACTNGGICAKDGSTLSTMRTKRTIPRTAGVPGAPTGLSATANGRTQIDLSWTAPASDGGSTITGYKIEVSVDSGSTWTVLVASKSGTSHEHTGLTASAARHYRVSAINTAGTGAASSTASATTAAPGVPGAPTGLSATANGRTQIDLSWTATASDGGSAVTGYKIEVSEDGGTTWTVKVGDTGSTTAKYAHTGLTASAARHYRVSAINTAGTGAASSTASATTAAAGVPGAPTGLSATANGRTQIDLSWTATASDGGSAVTGYKIEVSEDGGTTWTVKVGDTGSTTAKYAHTGLTASAARHYRVSAINTAGTGAASSTASATTAAAGVPGAPTGLSATANGRTQIDLSWTAPASDGGSTITGYHLTEDGIRELRRRLFEHRGQRYELRRQQPERRGGLHLPDTRRERRGQRRLVQRGRRHHCRGNGGGGGRWWRRWRSGKLGAGVHRSPSGGPLRARGHERRGQLRQSGGRHRSRQRYADLHAEGR